MHVWLLTFCMRILHNQYRLPLDFFSPILSVLAIFWNAKTPIFFSIFQLPIFAEPYLSNLCSQMSGLITRLKHAISPYFGIVWVLFYNI